MKTWSRRRFLGGAGALVALPLLETLQPRLARGATAVPDKRFIVFYFPCGRNPDTWVPKTTGTNFAMPASLSTLSALKANTLFLSGLSDIPSQRCRGIGDHAMATGTILTGVPVLNGGIFDAGVSIDQLIAQQMPATTRFPSLQWTSAEPTVCDVGTCSCIYTQCISWADARTPLAPISDPLAAYNQLFAGSDPGATAAQQAARQSATKSVLDYVLQDGNALIRTLSTSDKAKMDEYFTSVRALETSLFAPQSANCNPGNAPMAGVDYQTSVKAFCDMMVMALQCNLTHVISYMIEFDISYRSHPWVNAPLGHHAITHTGGQDALNQLNAVEGWEASQLAYMANALKAATDANGVSLLDNSTILATASMGLGGAHDHGHIAPMLIGNAGGAFKTGQHVDYNNTQSYNNMLVSLQQAFGIQSNTFGMDGTAPLPNIT